MYFVRPSRKKLDDTVKLFLSSTFKDMQAERDYLVTSVYPELEERLADLDLAFFDVDLRWGVPRPDGEEATEPINTWDYCRRSIEETEPFFVALLGHRYGTPVEQTLLAEDERKWAAGRSMTELEIRYAALDPLRPRRSSVFYFRETRPPKTALDAVRLSYVDDKAAGRLAVLKAEIERKYRVRHYQCKWNGSKFDHFDQLGQELLEDLWSRVLRDARYVDQRLWRKACRARKDLKRIVGDPQKHIPRQLWQQLVAEAWSARRPLEQEAREIERFCRDRLRWFRGREAELKLLERFALGPLDPSDSRIRIVHAVPGQGKTSLLAMLLRWLNARPNAAVVIPHFVGATERSSNEYDLLSRLNDVLDDQRLPVTKTLPRRGDDDLKTLRARLAHILRFYAGARPLVVVIDGLNQLSGGGDLAWLPRQFAENSRVVVSCVNHGGAAVRKSANPFAILQERGLPADCFVTLASLTAQDVEAITQDYLKEYSKILQNSVVTRIAELPQSGNPLYLLVLLRELRSLSGAELEAGAVNFVRAADTRFPETIDIFRSTLKKLEVFGSPAVATWFHYLTSSREGLSPTQLAFLLAAKFDPTAGSSAHRIRRSIRSYLQSRGRQIDFFHAAFRAAVEATFPVFDKQQVHRELATAFATLHREHGDQHASGEMVYHLVEAGEWEQVERSLNDGAYLLERIHQRDGARRLVLDFAHAFDQAQALHLEEVAGRIAEALLSALGTNSLRAEGLLLARVNAWLAYRPNNAFLRTTLLRGARIGVDLNSLDVDMRDLALRCRGRYAGLIRRDGRIGQADEAERILRPQVGSVARPSAGRRMVRSAVGRVRRWTGSQARQFERRDHRGTVEAYELGYIAFLRGEFRTAINCFEYSADLATAQGNRVSAAISRCLSGNCRFIFESGGDEIFRRTLLKARRIFETEAAKGDPDADRWVWNAWAHLFEIAFAQNDLVRGREYFQNLMDYDRQSLDLARLLIPYRARSNMLEQRWDAAIGLFNEYFQQGAITPENRQEALARIALDYGDALAGADQRQRAIQVWQDALTLPPDAGNRPWQMRIEQRLNNVGA